MSRDAYAALLILVMALGTFLLRFLPFFLFGGKRGAPAWVNYLGTVLPQAAIGMLVVYCLKDVSFTSGTRGIPEAIACVFVIVLQYWKRRSLFSIAAGTALYMVLVQTMFAG